MTGTRPPDPAIHFTASDYLATDLMAQRQITFGMYFYDTIFVNMPVDKTAFTTEANALNKMVLMGKGDVHFNKLRLAQSAVVHKYLTKNLLYAKIVCDHDPILIEKSGYDSSHPAEKAGEPETAGTTRVVKGSSEGTYRAMLARKRIKKGVIPDPKTHQKGVRYTIQITITPSDAASWKTIAAGCSFYKLIFKASDVTPLKKNYIRIFGINTAGIGRPNEAFPFSPEID